MVSLSGHDATAHPLLRLSGPSTRPNLAIEGSPPQQATQYFPQFEDKNWKKLALWLLRRRVCWFVLCFAVLLVPTENHRRSETSKPYTRRSPLQNGQRATHAIRPAFDASRTTKALHLLFTKYLTSQARSRQLHARLDAVHFERPLPVQPPSCLGDSGSAPSACPSGPAN